MKIKTRCEHCGKIYLMDENFLGRTAQCRNCGNQFVMTRFEEQAAAPDPAQAFPQPQAAAPGPAPAAPGLAQAFPQPQSIPGLAQGFTQTSADPGPAQAVGTPEPKITPDHPLPSEKAPAEKKNVSPAVIVLLVLILAVGVLAVGPALFPDIFVELGLPSLF